MLFNKRITLFLPEHTQLPRPFFPFQSHPFFQFLQFLHRRRCQIVIKGSSPDLIRRVNMVLINELIRASSCMVLHINILYVLYPQQEISSVISLCHIISFLIEPFPAPPRIVAPPLHGHFMASLRHCHTQASPPYHLARFPLCLLARFFSPASRFLSP